MPVPIQLLPSPALDRSLVPYTVTNFNRIRDAFLHAGSSFSFITGNVVGPWPQTVNITVPYKCDILIWSSVSYWANAPGTFLACQNKWDGTTLGGLLEQYFNEANSHKTLSAINEVRSSTAGAHTLTMDTFTGGINSDFNDRWRYALAFIEVP